MKEASFYEKLKGQRVHCVLCPHQCILAPEKIGICRVRKNIEGTLYSLVYGKTIALNVDPIEKKPLYHVYPGSRSLSMATVGCNFKCEFCQNYDISQLPDNIRAHEIPGREVTPEEIVTAAVLKNCKSIAYTYTEPTIYFEYAFDCAKLAHEQGILNVFVTNGYISGEALKTIAPYLDAANVDLKGFDEAFYRKIVGGKLSAVLDSLRLMRKLNIFIEVTTLIIPGHNDTDEQLRAIAEFIKNDLGVETPWHISRFFPRYRMPDRNPTSLKTLKRAYEIGRESALRYIYTGNLTFDAREDTLCHQCNTVLIERQGYIIKKNSIKKDQSCPACGAKIDGIGLSGDESL
ncbi:AmmeMemoRadiSam system radical SAM enzyme [candidate division KSB1 bacterium]|nr:AmmeMemoRadiSam system radical SAM enzyme [candidate division KSB1 bacterium]